MREIHWTEDSEAHIARHDVHPGEVEEALYSRPRYLRRGRDGTRHVYGTTNAGRHLFIVLADAADGRDWIVTARPMIDSERRTYQRKAK